jgi:hypothetical protein
MKCDSWFVVLRSNGAWRRRNVDGRVTVHTALAMTEEALWLGVSEYIYSIGRPIQAETPRICIMSRRRNYH